MSPSAHAVSDVIRLSQATCGKTSVCVGVFVGRKAAANLAQNRSAPTKGPIVLAMPRRPCARKWLL